MESDFVLSACLQHNFLPAQSTDRKELPPCFSSSQFTPDVARALVAGVRRNKDTSGYDSVDYRITRFDGVPRYFSIPHPMAYADLVLCIGENWNLGKLRDIESNDKNSLIRPFPNEDGRIMCMDYGNSLDKIRRDLRQTFGKRFVAYADIANFFPSIYSHSIPWAAVGMKEAKARRSNEEWFNELDQKVRRLKRNETEGIAIGPATSNIITEFILGKVDRQLRLGKFDFVRCIDDYAAYCTTEDEAQRFIRALSGELLNYKLILSSRKTRIVPMPDALSPNTWRAQIALQLSRIGEVSAYNAASYLELAIDLSRLYPDKSVLKYAFKSLLSRELSPVVRNVVLRFALTLSFYQPALLPSLEPLLGDAPRGKHPKPIPWISLMYSDELIKLSMEHAQHRRSEGMAWTLYYLIQYQVEIPPSLFRAIFETRDCVALLMLYLSGVRGYQAEIIQFANSIDRGDLYELDRYWMLVYELYRRGEIDNPYGGENAFDILKDRGIIFANL